MGLFDYFNKNNKQEINERETVISEQKTQPYLVFTPKSFNEVESIIDALRDKKPAIVHMEMLKEDTKNRVIDFLSGAIYALGGGLYELHKDVYMFSVSGIQII